MGITVYGCYCISKPCIPGISRVGQNHIYTVYTLYFWKGNHQNRQSYTVYIHGSGQPYIYIHTCPRTYTDKYTYAQSPVLTRVQFSSQLTQVYLTTHTGIYRSQWPWLFLSCWAHKHLNNSSQLTQVYLTTHSGTYRSQWPWQFLSCWALILPVRLLQSGPCALPSLACGNG